MLWTLLQSRHRAWRLRHVLRVLASMDQTAGTKAMRRFAVSVPEGEACTPAIAAAKDYGQKPTCSAAVAALLVATAAAASLQTESRCEAPAGDGVSVEVVEQAVKELWHTLEEQLHRVEASLPSQVELPGIPEPEVTLEGGGRVSVAFQLPQQLDIPAMLSTLRRRLRSPRFRSLEGAAAGSSVVEESSRGPEGRARRFVRRSSALGDLEVDVTEPRDTSRPARIEFRGQPTQVELDLMSAVLQSAMAPRRRGSFQEFEDLAGGLFGEEGPFGGHLGALEPFLGHVREFMEGLGPLPRELEGEAWGRGGGQGDEEWEPRDTQPTLPRRSKRFDELEGGPLGGSGLGARQREGGLQQPRAPQAVSPEERQRQAAQRRVESATRKLEAAGAQVFLPGKKEEVDWGILAGYEEQKRTIEDTLLLPLLHQEVYNEIAKGTRQHYSPNRPRAVLFEGPPGTGKTTSARVIATQAAVPLVYIPLESIVSKYYGESERMLADVLKTCESFPDGCIIFLDELDALATSRGGDMHEATRRLLGVLLRHLDGFDASKRTVVIGATNRKQDLDPALLSRFDTSVTFDLPDEKCRQQILAKYAQHLSDVELGALARATPGMAGRDLRDICEQAERRWASKIIRGQAPNGQLPPLSEYMDAARQRLREQAAA